MELRNQGGGGIRMIWVGQETSEVEQTSRVPDPGIVEVEPVDKVLYQEKFQTRQAVVVMDQKRLEELATADARLVRVRDGRGYINCDVI
jgi:hypothetical protein